MPCSICNDKFLLTQKDLLDGKICRSCLKKLPEVVLDSEYPLNKITVQDIEKIINWKNNKECIYRKEFTKTTGYGRLKIDSLHGYLAICNEDELEDGCFYDDSGMVMDLTRIKNISFDMLVGKATAEKVEVMVVVSISLIDFPVDIINIPIKKDFASVNVSDGRTVRFSLPYGAQIISDEVIRINHSLVENAEFRMKCKFIDELDLAKAMGLFMVENEFNEKEIKQTRKRLLKAFHPDEGICEEKYAQKIGDAYAVLLNYLKEKDV